MGREDYIFPEDDAVKQNLTLLETAKAWKKLKLIILKNHNYFSDINTIKVKFSNKFLK